MRIPITVSVFLCFINYVLQKVTENASMHKQAKTQIIEKSKTNKQASKTETESQVFECDSGVLRKQRFSCYRQKYVFRESSYRSEEKEYSRIAPQKFATPFLRERIQLLVFRVDKNHLVL